MRLFRTLRCKNCEKPTDFPSSILLGIERSPLRSSTGEPAIAIACPECKHVFPYIGSDLRLNHDDNPDQFALPGGKSVFAIKIQCDDMSCESRAEVRAIVENELSKKGIFDTKLPSTLPELAPSWTLHDIRCAESHPITAARTINF